MITSEQFLGLITGILFGFFLQKGRVLRFDKQVSAMLLRDMTIIKFMTSAILVGMVGIYILKDLGVITLSHKSMNVGGVIVGAALFGIGWAIMGFCPGTSVGALAEGRIHAFFAVIGMIAGAGIYAELYPFFKKTVLSWADFGKIGVPEVLGINHWIIIAVYWIVGISFFIWFEKKGL